jgi:hypothetical protein
MKRFFSSHSWREQERRTRAATAAKTKKVFPQKRKERKKDRKNINFCQTRRKVLTKMKECKKITFISNIH